MNNNDKLNSMTIEQKAKWLYLRIAKCYNCPLEYKCRIEHQGANKCTKALIEWLTQES